MQPAPRPVFDTSGSPHAALTPASPASVRLTDAFWEPRMRANREKTLFGQHRQIEESGRLDNFRRASGRKTGLDFQGFFFNDSDVYKWLEGAAWSLGTHPDPELKRLVDEAADEIAAAQQPDGYLNTYFMFERGGERWTDLKDKHEMYCAGHFIQAAIAHKRATGDEALMRVAVRLADHIVSVFGPEARAGACGHQEIEMAMVELYRETGVRRYLDAAVFFVDVRGRKPPILEGREYLQDHKPFATLEENVGHAVRMLYMNVGVTDIVLETGDEALRAALDRLWEDFTARKLYLTGGAGSRWEWEAFGPAYELPSRAYAETCAGIAAVMWAARMNALTGEARYVDLLERALYNGVMSGLSLDGNEYFYQNPLSDDGNHRRKAWFGCACCPPNLARLLAELPGYVFATGDGTLAVNLYAEGSADLVVDGTTVRVATETRYPWDGTVTLRIDPERPAEFVLLARVPAWAEGARLLVNGVPGVAVPGEYAEIHRMWKPGDIVHLELPMPVRAWRAHPRVEACVGRMAFTRGPLVYCFEAVDNPGVDVRAVRVAADAMWSETFRPDLLNGVMTVSTRAFAPAAAAGEMALYHPASEDVAPETPVTLTAIPYYAWANREPGPMTVWLNA